jgi:arabinofuranan 3-O-arabinosyltransferase
MTTAARPAAGESGGGRLVWRFRLLTCCLVLGALAFIQEPGRIVSDTKLDLALAPGDFLGRAAHLWDPEGAFGQVQNQAYGYLFPMGPFFWLGDLAGMPPWVVQRLWWTLVMVVAFLGVVKLAALLGIGSPASRVVAGFAYALSPRMLTTLGPISIEAWPSALVPWVLAALVWGTTTGPPRRAAALAALGVGAVGGVNAAATSAVLPLGVLWLLTRSPGPRRRSMMLWWPVFTLLATLWWLVPLFLLGRYSPPFLDFIEPAAVTTFPTTLFEALRGTSNWVPYVDPAWRAGNDLVTTPFLVLNSAVLLVLGVVGLAMTDLPHRRFLLTGLLAGMLLVTAGHLGEVHGWWAAEQRDLLDGVLAPLRNVHKFDPVIRLPLVLALAHSVSVLSRPRPRGRGRPATASVGVLVLASVATAGAAGPLLADRLAHAGAFEEVPAYWEQAAEWLQDHDDGGRALLVPGSSFGTYVWGNPRDEPMQALAGSPWAVRNAIPLAPPGNIRMLDAVEAALVSGEGSPGLADYLARAGVDWVVVRNDLDRGEESVNPVRVRNAVASSPGLDFRAAFGPLVGGRARLDRGEGESPRVLVDGGWQTRYPAIEVYQVVGARIARAGPVGAVVAGGPEDLLTLADLGVLPDSPTVLAVDRDEEIGPAPLVLTDGLRRRERNFGRLHDSASQVLPAGEQSDRDVPARDYLLPGQEGWETVARWEGVRTVTSSSSVADAGALGEVRPEHGAFAALDGEPSTQWVSRGSTGPAWLQVDLHARQVLTSVAVTAGGAFGTERQPVRVRTEQGAGDTVSLAPGRETLVRVPEGPTSWIRVEAAGGTTGQRLAIGEVDVPDVRVSRPLVTPVLPESLGVPDAIVLSATAGWRSACVPVRLDLRCLPGETRAGDEALGIDRVVTMAEPARYPVTAEVRPRAGQALEGLLQEGQLVTVSASSTAVPEPAASASAAVDGVRGTTWLAALDDDAPTLTVSWVAPRRVEGLRLALDRQAAASPAESVVLRYDGEEQVARVRGGGRVEVEPFRTQRLEIELSTDEPARGFGTDGELTEFGVGVSELRIRGQGSFPVPLSTRPEVLPCGTGPEMVVDGRRYETSVTASRLDLFLGRLVEASLCGRDRSVTLRSGENRIAFARSEAFTGARLLLGDAASVTDQDPSVSGPDGLERQVLSPTERTLLGSSLTAAGALALGENWNDGWSDGAPSEGEHSEGALDPIVVDGWQQGWVLPAGDDTFTAEFVPDRWYRLGLASGGLLLLGLLVAAAVTGRRAGGTPPAGAGEHRRLPVLLALGGVVTTGLLAGWWGVAVSAGAAVLVLLLGRRMTEERWSLAVGAPLAAAALVMWWRPWGSSEGWAGELALPQLLVLFSLALLVLRDLSWGRLEGRRPGGLRFRIRMKGSSTAR